MGLTDRIYGRSEHSFPQIPPLASLGRDDIRARARARAARLCGFAALRLCGYSIGLGDAVVKSRCRITVYPKSRLAGARSIQTVRLR